LSVRDSFAADEIEQLGLNVLIDLIDWYSQLHGRPLGKASHEASLGASSRLARTHIVERFLWKRGVSVLDSWSLFRWRCFTIRVSFFERSSKAKSETGGLHALCLTPNPMAERFARGKRFCEAEPVNTNYDVKLKVRLRRGPRGLGSEAERSATVTRRV
jgi:hypothetical protein